MTMSPGLELQGAIVARLEADAAVNALVNGRVYDAVPPDEDRIAGTGEAFPYVSLGPSDDISDDADCVTGLRISVQIDCWSRAVGFPEVKALSDAVRRALHEYDLPLADNALVYIRHNQTRTFRDPDGQTSHAAMEFSVFIEQP